MAVLFRLYLHKFTRGKIIATILSGCCGVAAWFLRGLAETVIFGSIWQDISSRFLNGRPMWTSNHPDILLLSVPVLAIVAILILVYLDARREFYSDRVVLTLTEMHRLMFARAEKQVSKTGKNTRWLESAIPVLCHRWGIVDIGNYKKWRSHLLRRAKRAAPSTIKDSNERAFKLASIGAKMRDEILASRKWAEADLEQMGEWLDGQDKGVGAIRDSQAWQTLDDSLRDYRADSVLKRLIEKHQRYSYYYCSVYVGEHLLDRERRNPAARLMLDILSQMPLNRSSIRQGLEDILNEVRKRMKVLQRREKQKTLAPSSAAGHADG